MAISYWWAGLTSSAEPSPWSCQALHKAELPLWCETTKSCKMLRFAYYCCPNTFTALWNAVFAFILSPLTHKWAAELQELQHPRGYAPLAREGAHQPLLNQILVIQSRSNNPWLAIKGPLRSCTTSQEGSKARENIHTFSKGRQHLSAPRAWLPVWCLLTQWPRGKSFQPAQLWLSKSPGRSSAGDCRAQHLSTHLNSQHLGKPH